MKWLLVMGSLLMTSVLLLLITLNYQPPTVFAQACQAYLPNQSGVNNGLISTPSLLGKFGNTSQTCVSNLPAAAIPSYNLSTQQYTSLKSKYYSQSKQNRLGNLPNNMAFSGDGLYNNSTLNISSTPTGSGTEVVFVDSDMTISSNIIYHTNDSNGGLVFIVGGNLYINPSVNQIDGVLIVGGNIYTACSSQPCGTTSSIQVTSPLVINGNLISLSTGASQVYFERNLSATINGNNVAAEQANLQAKYFLILKNLLSDTLIIETEGTNYTGGLSSSAPTPTLVASPQTVGLDKASHGSFNLTWTGSGAISCTAISNPAASNFSGNVTTSGSTTITVNSAGSYKYTISCTNFQNISGSASTTVTVSSNPDSVSWSPNPINAGTAGTVSWTSTSPAAGDTIGLYTLSAPDSAYISFVNSSTCSSLSTTSSGSCSYSIPQYLPQGYYEVRYEKNNFQSAQSISAPFTIKN